ncbi:DUF6912 family protein [Actinomadura harenae]|uniref:Uncharacterized protein n=1 Tax=Actinomadura harenae TaxID=2483351 RepID=A0A3M2LA66_9ACTN|nr:hypothetical protein [Actinomadura harenae]RMI34492.1 hypothetical protein EBO15_41010 [Actinomadura harenae]
MRVYLPSTLADLARVLSDREVGPAPLTAYAVTPELQEWYSAGDIEEFEYAAMTSAARASLRLLAGDPDAEPRRVVLAAEVPDAVVRAVRDEDEPARVEITAVVPWKKIASGHVDDTAAEADVRAAALAVPAADAGDDDAAFTVDGAEGHELLWYATQELSDLL